MKVNLWAVVSRAVEEGAAAGYRRAFKHDSAPTEGHILACVVEGVEGALGEVVDFGDWYAETGGGNGG